MKPVLDYPFTQDEFESASREWGCNCGPSALAFACQVSLGKVREAIVGFDEKRYTSPSMMSGGIRAVGMDFDAVENPSVDAMCHETPALVRVQWTGPWTQPGVNPKWAYWHTHWVATWRQPAMKPGHASLVFDCNAGVTMLDDWVANVVPTLTTAPRADGGWFPTHVWRVRKSVRP